MWSYADRVWAGRGECKGGWKGRVTDGLIECVGVQSKVRFEGVWVA